MQTVNLSSFDGTPLALRRFEPPQAARGSVVIAAATGVRQNYYAPFATWLAAQGWRVWTFDYRGMGDSAPAQGLRGYRASLSDWVRDYEQVVAHARADLPQAPLLLLGHSLGAQLPGLFAAEHGINGLLGVGSGSGYWRHLAPAVRRLSPFFWHVVVPLSTALCGYFPGRRLGMVGDLPAPAIRQWRRWCLHPQYSAGVEKAHAHYARVRFPVVSLCIEDDEMMSRRAIEDLSALYVNAPRRVHSVRAADFGVRRIGHLGAFRPEHAQALWPQMQRWLLGMADMKNLMDKEAV